MTLSSLCVSVMHAQDVVLRPGVSYFFCDPWALLQVLGPPGLARIDIRMPGQER